MTGPELKQLRHDLGDAIGQRLSTADMARICGLKDPERNGKDTWRKWEEGEGPSGPVAVLLTLYACAADNHPIPDGEPPRGDDCEEDISFRAMMRDIVLRRLS